MSRPVLVRRVIAPAVGLGLVFLVLWQVGWRDRVIDAAGATHRGKIVERSGDAVVLRTEDGPRTFAAPREAHEGLRTAFGRLSPGRAAVGIALHLAALLVIFLRWWILLRGADMAMPYRDVVRLSWVGQFFGVVLPGGVGAGDVVRAVYAVRAYPGRRTRAVVTVFVDRVVGLVALCIVAAAAVLVSPPRSQFADVRLVVLGVLGTAVAGSALLFSARVRHALRITHLLRRLPFQAVIVECEAAVTIYGGRLGTLALATGAAFVAHGLLLTAFYFYAGALGTSLTLLAVGGAIPVAQMLSAIPGLPGGWGIGDYAFLTFLPAAGVAPATAVALSFTYRILHMLLSLPGALMLGRGRDRIHVPDAGAAALGEPTVAPD